MPEPVRCGLVAVGIGGTLSPQIVEVIALDSGLDRLVHRPMPKCLDAIGSVACTSLAFVSGAGQIYLWPSGEGRSYMMIETSPFSSSVTSST